MVSHENMIKREIDARKKKKSSKSIKPKPIHENMIKREINARKKKLSVKNGKNALIIHERYYIPNCIENNRKLSLTMPDYNNSRKKRMNSYKNRVINNNIKILIENMQGSSANIYLKNGNSIKLGKLIESNTREINQKGNPIYFIYLYTQENISNDLVWIRQEQPIGSYIEINENYYPDNNFKDFVKNLLEQDGMINYYNNNNYNWKTNKYNKRMKYVNSEN